MQLWNDAIELINLSTLSSDTALAFIFRDLLTNFVNLAVA